MQRFCDMLRYFRKREGLSQQELADRMTASGTPMTRSRIAMYENGYRQPDPETLNAFADFFNVNLDTLMGRGMPNLIPLMGRIACGTPLFAEENIEEYISLPTNVKADYALTCRGDSMIDIGIESGDVVYIRQCDDVDDGQIAAVLMGDDSTLKRVFHVPGGGIMLIAENPARERWVYQGGEAEAAGVKIMGQAVAYLHRLT